jgi:hypothetical protein
MFWRWKFARYFGTIFNSAIWSEHWGYFLSNNFSWGKLQRITKNPRPESPATGLGLSPKAPVDVIPICFMVLIYLPTKLGDF